MMISIKGFIPFCRLRVYPYPILGGSEAVRSMRFKTMVTWMKNSRSVDLFAVERLGDGMVMLYPNMIAIAHVLLSATTL